MAHREHVPLVSFNPSMGKGYRSDVNANTYPQMAPIRFGLGLPDILQNGAKGIPGAQDVVFGQVPYGVFKLHLVWPGYYAADLIPIDLYANRTRPTRASIAMQAATLFLRYIEVCKSRQCGTARWRIGDGKGDLAARNIIFNSLVNTFENVWQIDFDVII